MDAPDLDNPGSTTCPSCGLHYWTNYIQPASFSDDTYQFEVFRSVCPPCGSTHIFIRVTEPDGFIQDVETCLVYPKTHSFPSCPPDVPEALARDYEEAALVFANSPRASAALSRRCLEHLLTEWAGADQRSLFDKIEHVIEHGDLSGPLAEELDHLRLVGNFAAHPIKSKNSGAIIQVEPGEAEANLALLLELFDHYFVAPVRRRKRMAALDAKATEAGKPVIRPRADEVGLDGAEGAT